MQSTNYDNFAQTFGKSRKNMRWEEVDRLLDQVFVLIFEGRNNQSGKREKLGITNYELRMADIGCGNGRLLHHILEHPRRGEIQAIFSEYVGLDLSRILLAQAKKDGEIREVFPEQTFLPGDMRDFCNILEIHGTFDTIFFIASFHHLRDSSERLSVLSQARELLAPNGIIAMTNWNLLHLEHKKYLTSKISDYPDGSADFLIKIGAHQRFYHAFSEEELIDLAEHAGLAIEEMDFGGKNSITLFKPQIPMSNDQ